MTHSAKTLVAAAVATLLISVPATAAPEQLTPDFDLNAIQVTDTNFAQNRAFTAEPTQQQQAKTKVIPNKKRVFGIFKRQPVRANGQIPINK